MDYLGGVGSKLETNQFWEYCLFDWCLKKTKEIIYNTYFVSLNIRYFVAQKMILMEEGDFYVPSAAWFGQGDDNFVIISFISEWHLLVIIFMLLQINLNI
jgi:hypothetical protein